MLVARYPDLNIVDAIWVTPAGGPNAPYDKAVRVDKLLASSDPIALDCYAAKSVLFPVDSNPRHAPDYPGVDRWLTDCMNLVNSLGGIARPSEGIHVSTLTKYESEYRVVSASMA